MIKGPTDAMSPGGVLINTALPSSPITGGSYSIRELEMRDVQPSDTIAIARGQTTQIIAEQLGSVAPLRHRFIEDAVYTKAIEETASDSALRWGASVFFGGGAIATTNAAMFSGDFLASAGPSIVLVAILAMITFAYRYDDREFELKASSYKDLLQGRFIDTGWKHLAKNLLFKTNPSRIRRIIKQYGISKKQLLKGRRPITEGGVALNGKDIHDIFAKRKGAHRPDALSDFARLMWSMRAAGPLALSLRNLSGAGAWFNQFAEVVTGVSPRDIRHLGLTEVSSPFLTLLRDCSYYQSSLPLSGAASTAYLIRYYADTGHGDHAVTMFESLNHYLNGDYGLAFLNHQEVVDAIPGDEDANVEDIGVRAIHQRLIAGLIRERMDTMKKPSEELTHFAESSAIAAAKGLRELADEGEEYLRDVVGFGSLLQES